MPSIASLGNVTYTFGPPAAFELLGTVPWRCIGDAALIVSICIILYAEDVHEQFFGRNILSIRLF